ncbi:MAG: hypothetical protein LUG95_08430 [Clostridiales bacterium]|nr:hypothetical protein [Clostridiales bacterium]
MGVKPFFYSQKGKMFVFCRQNKKPALHTRNKQYR